MTITLKTLAGALAFSIISMSATAQNPVTPAANATIEEQSYRDVNVQEFSYLIDQIPSEKLFLLDVRTEEEFADGHIPNATLIPIAVLADSLSEIPEDRVILIYCRSGNRSRKAAQILLDQGYSPIINLDGGFRDWVAQGFPTEI